MFAKKWATRRRAAICGTLTLAVSLAAQHALAVNAVTTLTTFATNAYFASDTNSCAIDLNNLTTVGGFQFATYYDANQNLMLARRATGSTTWQTYSTGFAITDASDDHNVPAIAIDSIGDLHISWDMHNVVLNYAISNVSVLTPTLNSIPFTKLNASNAPTLFASAGSTTNEVTYPDFYQIPNSPDLLFAYRNGGAGGGSGNGNEYFDIYDPATKTFTNNFVVNGEQTSVNAYLNNLVYDHNGNLLMSWTWRATPNWQTNSNIMFAQSPDNGLTWTTQNGASSYVLPIIQSLQNGGTAASVGQIIKTIPQNSSFINQTSMAVDAQNRPMVASYWVPVGSVMNPIDDPSNPHNSTYKVRQYMLEYYTGTQWATSQVSSRTSDTAIDTSGNDVRDLGRPIVLVDSANRILVVTRSENSSMGSANNPNTPNNDIVVFYTTDSMTGGATLPTTLHWNSVTLNSANMGIWEPTYDSTLWQSSNQLNLFYEPVGLTGQTSGTASVLGWDEPAFFAMTWNNTGATGNGITWDTTTNQNFVNGGGPSTFHIGDTVTFNDTNNNHYAVTVSGTVSPASLTVNNSSGNYTFSGTGHIAGTTSLTKSGTSTLTLTTANTYSGGTIINAGAIIAAAPTALGTGSVTIHTGATLQLQSNLAQAVTLPALQLDGAPNAWSATVDITNNKLIVEDAANHTATLATLQNQVLFGLSNSAGILSTALPANTALAVLDNAVTQFKTFGTIPVDANSILIAPELIGDANADGTVDLNDLTTVLNNLGSPTPNWTSGNFDHAPTIDLTDLNDVLNNFGQSFSSPTLAASPPPAQPTPEPTTGLLLISAVAIPLLRRRRP
jgi:autotransporter-associated beta strand protein